MKEEKDTIAQTSAETSVEANGTGAESHLEFKRKMAELSKEPESPDLPESSPRAAETILVEEIGGRELRYKPLGEYLIAAAGVCGGRPTVKGRRLDARHIAARLELGHTREKIARDFDIPLEAVDEVAELATTYDYEQSYL